MKKAELRKVALQQRKNLSPEQESDLNYKLLSQFSLIDLTSVKVIHIFLPIKEKHEPDTFLIIDWLKAHYPEIKVIVPKADFETALMTNHYYEGHEDLKLNIFNILEPQKAEIHTGDVDIVIIPLLAFDTNGYRVGYGKGFYDRFLQEINTQKIGLSFFNEPVVIDDVNDYDIRLDKCITPDTTFVFPLSSL